MAKDFLEHIQEEERILALSLKESRTNTAVCGYCNKKWRYIEEAQATKKVD